jgi:hypothetical protein
MRAVLAFALRRASARLVVAAAAGGLVYVVYLAVRPLRWVTPGDACGTCVGHRVVESSPWDLAIASLGVLIAIVVAVALYRRFSIRR